MQDILVNGVLLRGQSEEERKIADELAMLQNKIHTIRNGMRFKLLSNELIGNQLRILEENVGMHEKAMSNMQNVLDDAINKYNKAETQIIEHMSDSRTFWEKLSQDKKVEAAVLEGEWKKQFDWFGIGGAVNVSGDVLGGDVSLSGKADFDLMNKEAGISGGVSAGGHLAQGEIQGSIGNFSATLWGAAGVGAVKGEAKAVLFEDNKFKPGLGVEAKASVSGAAGKLETKYGDEQYNRHFSAEGTVGYAEASAGVGVGFLGVNSETGKEIIGVKAEAGAEVCAVKGEVKSGFTFMGIDVDVGVEGKAGALGVAADASITNEKVSVSAGASAILGVGINVSIDFTDFELPKFEEITW